jgi:hypothetical protein
MAPLDLLERKRLHVKQAIDHALNGLGWSRTFRQPCSFAGWYAFQEAAIIQRACFANASLHFIRPPTLMRITIRHQDNCHFHAFTTTFPFVPVLNLLDQHDKMSNPNHPVCLPANAEYAFSTQIFASPTNYQSSAINLRVWWAECELKETVSPVSPSICIILYLGRCPAPNWDLSIVITPIGDLKPFIYTDGGVNSRTKERAEVMEAKPGCVGAFIAWGCPQTAVVGVSCVLIYILFTAVECLPI